MRLRSSLAAALGGLILAVALPSSPPSAATGAFVYTYVGLNSVNLRGEPANPASAECVGPGRKQVGLGPTPRGTRHDPGRTVGDGRPGCEFHLEGVAVVRGMGLSASGGAGSRAILRRPALASGAACGAHGVAHRQAGLVGLVGGSGVGGGLLSGVAAELFVDAQGFFELVFEDDDAAGGVDGGALVDEVAGAHGDP